MDELLFRLPPRRAPQDCAPIEIGHHDNANIQVNTIRFGATKSKAIGLYLASG
jgi:hypothetical protein